MIIAEIGNWTLVAETHDVVPVRLHHYCKVRPRADPLGPSHYYPGRRMFPKDHKGCITCEEPIPPPLEAMYLIAMLGFRG